jgi:uncharacterized protein (DUF849 family)
MTEEIPQKVVIDCATGESSYIPLTPEEIAEREAMAAQAEAERLEREAAEQAKAEAKASAVSKLEALGLSEAEITALLG